MANYTQKAILQTFEDMLREMSFDKVTVSELVRRCEISSNTFYYHYRDIYDLFDKWLEKIKIDFLAQSSGITDWAEIRAEARVGTVGQMDVNIAAIAEDLREILPIEGEQRRLWESYEEYKSQR